MRRQLHARGAYEPKHRVLGHNVVDAPGSPASGWHAPRAHDAAPHAQFHHGTSRVLHAEGHAARVDGEEAVEVGDVEVEDGLVGGAEYAGVAEHDVQLAMSVDCRLHELFDLVFVCHVTVDVAAPVVMRR